jgi:hypothetical protein
MGIFSKDPVGSLEWEFIKTAKKGCGPQYLYRAKVIGGWLLESENYTASLGGLTFLPDPNHEWQLDPV